MMIKDKRTKAPKKIEKKPQKIKPSKKLKEMKLIVIEDEESLGRVLKDKLEKEGYEVIVASDGEAGLEAIKKENPDLVLLDLILPKKTGFEVLEALKNDPEGKRFPVIVLSNLGEDDNIKKAFDLGAIDYFVKTQHPINEIIEKVKGQLAKGI